MNSKKPSIIFAGSAQFACASLKLLQQYADIKLVLTQPQKPSGRGLLSTACPLDQLAQELNLRIMRPPTLRDLALKEELQALGCDFLVVVAYGKIIPQWLLDLPKHAPINVHGSLLPRWRGASPIQHALLAGDSLTGVGIMRMSAGLDEGPVYKEAAIEITGLDDHISLEARLSELGANLLLETLSSFPLEAVEQIGEVTFAPKIQKTDGQINLSETCSEVLSKYKAFKKWPGLFAFTTQGLRVKLLEIGINPLIEHSVDVPVGHCFIINGSLYLQMKDGAIELMSIQLEGKQALICKEALVNRNHWLIQKGLVFAP